MNKKTYNDLIELMKNDRIPETEGIDWDLIREIVASEKPEWEEEFDEAEGDFLGWTKIVRGRDHTVSFKELKKWLLERDKKNKCKYCNSPIEKVCIRCSKKLIGRQQKYCSKKCKNKIWKQKHWKKINAKIKTKKIEKKVRRKVLTEQEIKKRENND